MRWGSVELMVGVGLITGFLYLAWQLRYPPNLSPYLRSRSANAAGLKAASVRVSQP